MFAYVVKMKDYSPGKLAFLSALFVTMTLAGIMLLAEFLSLMQVVWYVYPASSLIIFTLTFLMFHYILHHFLYNKIRLIYKTILDIKIPQEERQESLAGNSDMIVKAGSDVEAWASDKKQEIEDLKKLEEYRREFIGNVSHELKTPIFNIQGYVLTLLDGGLDDPNVNRSYLLRAENSINRMISILEELDTIAKLESGQLKLNFSCFDMQALVKEVYDMLEMEAGKKQIRMVFGQSQDRPIMVYADRQNIHQLVTNLVVNAIKYGTERGRVKISFFDMDKHILTEVTDSGIGIPREELPRVFERFYRGEKSRSRHKGGGSGLGLAIVKHIIEAHRQTINVRSTLGVGTTFAFTLSKAN